MSAEHVWSNECPCRRNHGERTPSHATPPCFACDNIHVAADVVAVNRFAGVTGYRTTGGEVHATRQAAQKWLCEQRRAVTSPAQTRPDGAR